SLGPDIVVPTGKEDGFLDRKAVAKFVEEHYGPSLQSIEEAIAQSDKASGRSRDGDVEAIQHVKTLLSKVGSLEFRIVANDFDDNLAIRDAKVLLNAPHHRPKLEEWQIRGLVPGGPTTNGQPDGEPRQYE